MVTLACGVCLTSMWKRDLECYCLGVTYSLMSWSGCSFSPLFIRRAFADSSGRRAPCGLAVALYISSSIETMSFPIKTGSSDNLGEFAGGFVLFYFLPPKEIRRKQRYFSMSWIFLHQRPYLKKHDIQYEPVSSTIKLQSGCSTRSDERWAGISTYRYLRWLFFCNLTHPDIGLDAAGMTRFILPWRFLSCRKQVSMCLFQNV